MGAWNSCRLGGVALALAAAAAAGAARADDAKGQAVQAAIGDAVSGAAVLATGVVTLHPIASVLSVGMKAATLHYAESLPAHERPAAYASATAMWSGATVNNVCLTAAFLATGGALVPVCVVAGVAWGMKTWNDGKPERDFWQVCTALRDFAQPPNFECVYPLPTAQAVTQAPAPQAVPGEVAAP